MEISRRTTGLFLYGILLSALIGLISFTFLFLENSLSALLWTHLPTEPLVSNGYKLILVAAGTFLLLQCQPYRKNWM